MQWNSTAMGKHARPGRCLRVVAPVALTVALAMFAVGCTADSAAAENGGRNGHKSSSSGALQATLNHSMDPVAIVDASSPGQVSIGVSRAVFAAAPIVVVAQAGDRSGVDDGAKQAERFGVPLLLADGPEQQQGDASTSMSPPSTTSPSAQALKAEIARLAPKTVLAMGAGVKDGLGKLPEARIVTDAKALPTVSPVRVESAVVVLVREGLDESAAAAAAAVRGVGVQLVRINGPDPRGDPGAIAALAKQPPRRVLAVGAGFDPVDRLTRRLQVAATGTQLPGGGQSLFPGRRLVALYGRPGAPELGVLGEQGLEASISRAKKLAADYTSLSAEPVVPAFEIIATTAQGAPGSDGDYSGESDVSELRPWVEKASEEGVYVVLDLQPGRANLLDQAKLYTDLLRLPNVGLALDSEWKLTPQQRPLEQIGGVDAAEVNSVTTWLADLTANGTLPQKLLVLHQFRLSMLRDEDKLDLSRDEVQVLIHMDGQGTPALKDATWRAVTGAAPKGVPFGWKNFYDEDRPMLSPEQTMTKQPTPFMISYQ